MKLSLFILLSCPLMALAENAKECLKKITQAEKSECMALSKDEAIGDLVSSVSLYCSKKEEIKESEEGTIYPMLIDQCLEEELRELNKLFKELKN